MKKLLLAISLIFLFITIPAHAADKNSACSTTLSSDEQELYNIIMEYRKSLGLPSIPVSPSLSFVAQTHVRDLQAHPPSGACNMHSWSTYGSWSACCYTPDHAQAQCMWNKPGELTGYQGYGFEISYGGSLNATPAGALRGWQSSSGHNAVIANTGIWKSHSWKAVGIGIYGSYAVVWFGEEDDPCSSAATKTSLFDAVNSGEIKQVKAAIAAGADVNEKDEYGTTVLYYAARKADKELVGLLLSNGADANILNNEGDTPLYYAVKGDDTGEIDNIDVVRLLIEKGADVNAKNGSILWTAARYGELDVVKLLLSHKADPNLANALHAAALGGNLEITQLLLANGADPTLKDYKGQTPLDIIKGPEMSVYEDQAKIIKALKAAMQKNKK